MIRDVADFSVRVLDSSELRASSDVFFIALHSEPLKDARWKYLERFYELGRAFGAFAGDRMVGTAMSFRSALAVPGGVALPMAAVSAVGVRADFTRRGVLTELMRTQLKDCVARGDALAGLHASEGAIYGRFGYGVGVISRTIRVESRRAQLRPEVPRSGEVRLLDRDEVLDLLPAIYDRIAGEHPGMMARPPGWWSMAYERRLYNDDQFQVAVHTGAEGPDGFVGYLPSKDNPQSIAEDVTLRVHDLQGTPSAIIDLWRFLLGVDLVREVAAFGRPMDEPIEAALVNQHVVRSELDDDLWLRIVDVPRALAARSYGDAEPIVIEVRDRLLPNNSDRYLIGPSGVDRTKRAAVLAMDVDALAMLYLGTTRASALADVGRIEAYDPKSLPLADRLFATDATAWCGTGF